MADNIILNPGSGGATLATDDIAGFHYQIVKLSHGALDSSTIVSTASPLPVDLRTDNLAGNLDVNIAASGATITVDSELTTADLDTGAGTDTRAVVGLALAESGGALLVGSANPLPVSAASLPLPTGAATAANQLPDGHAVTVDNAAGASAVNVQDGGNVLSVDWNGTAPPIGAGTEAAALRVTVATDSTGLLSIDDNGGSITVDNGGAFVVQADSVIPGGGATNLGKAVDAVAGATDTGVAVLAVRDDALTTLTPIDGDYVHLRVNSTGALHVTGGGGGTEYVEDDAAPANPTASAVALVRQDTPAALVSLDGDIVAQRATNFGAAYVQILDSSGNFINSFGGSGGTSHADDAAFTIGSASSITPAGYLADETTPDSVDEGDVGVPRMTLSRKPYAVLTDATAENNAGVDASGHLQVDIAADSVGIGGGTQYTEDVPAVADPVGNQIIARRRDTPPAETTLDGDNVALNATNKGELYVKHIDAVPVTDNGGNLSIDWAGTVPPIGAGTEAAALRVTVATDSTGVLSIDDNGGAITVDNGGTFAVQADSVIPGTGATNLGKAEDAVHTGGDVGVMALAVRKDADTASALDGDYHSLLLDATGFLKVNAKDATVTSVVPGTAAANLGKAEDAVHATGDVGVMALAVRKDADSASALDGDYHSLLVDPTGYLKVTAKDAVVSSVTPGTAAANLGKAEDAVHATGDVGVQMLGVRKDSDLASAADGDYASLHIDSLGFLKVNVKTSQGSVAHDQPVSGNPFQVAAEARSAESAVANGDVVRMMADLVGKLINQPFAPVDLQWNATGNKTDTTDLVLKAATAGVKNYLTDLIIANASATNTTAIVKNGVTEIARFPVPANGGVVHRFACPIATSVNTALNIASAAAVTTMYFTGSGYQGR